MKCLLIVASLLVLSAKTLDGARILAIIPTPSISHQLPFRNIVLELARRGHHVTLMTTDPIGKTIENYTEIDLSQTYNFWRSSLDFTSMHELSPIEMLYMWGRIGKEICDIQLGSSQMKKFLQARQKFDVIIIERLVYQCYNGLVHHLGSPPVIGYVCHAPPANVYYTHGNPINPAYSPDVSLDYSDRMSFWERLYNTFSIVRIIYLLHSILIPAQEDILREHFGPGAPSIYESERNFSLLLVNNHFSMNYPRPLLPNVVEVPGLHIEKHRKPLPENLKKFLNGADHGFIYFSLGSNVKASTMSEEKRMAFLKAFSQLPQRVLWKWETGNMSNLPDNVMVAKWLPQQDILAHQHIRLFITHGGLQSLNEAAYFGVPLIGIPFVGDQAHNVAAILKSGVGTRLQFKDVTDHSLLSSIRTVLSEKRYRENMKRLSAVFRDHQETALERAVWWVEYVVRHQGAPHLRTAALDLHWWQLLLLDVVAFVVVTAALAIYVMYRVVRYTATTLYTTQKLKKV